MSEKIKILFVINNIGFVYSHRLPMILGAFDAGYEVHVATHYKPDQALKYLDKIQYHLIHFNRNSINPFTEIKPITQLIKLYKSLKPDLIHHMCKKSVLYGCLITRFMRKTPVANTVPGLGYLFISKSFKSKAITTLLKIGFRFGFKRSRLKIIFQNDDDRTLFETNNLLNTHQCIMIRGSGVDVECYQPVEKNHSIILIVLAARLLWDKGVGEFVTAARNLKHLKARFALVGDIDPLNPASVTQADIQHWLDEGIIEHWGWCSDMISVLQQADIACLPSYREGMPKSLLEAAASGLPIVTTIAPGCRDVIVHDESGFQIPVKDTIEMTGYLEQLIESPQLRAEMGQKARERVINHFSTDIIVRQTLDLYAVLLGPDAQARSDINV